MINWLYKSELFKWAIVALLASIAIPGFSDPTAINDSEEDNLENELVKPDGPLDSADYFKRSLLRSLGLKQEPQVNKSVIDRFRSPSGQRLISQLIGEAPASQAMDSDYTGASPISGWDEVTTKFSFIEAECPSTYLKSTLVGQNEFTSLLLFSVRSTYDRNRNNHIKSIALQLFPQNFDLEASMAVCSGSPRNYTVSTQQDQLHRNLVVLRVYQFIGTMFNGQAKLSQKDTVLINSFTTKLVRASITIDLAEFMSANDDLILLIETSDTFGNPVKASNVINLPNCDGTQSESELNEIRRIKTPVLMMRTEVHSRIRETRDAAAEDDSATNRPKFDISAWKSMTTNKLAASQLAERGPCQLMKIIVDFEQMGWNWVVQPRAVESGICAGSCTDVTRKHDVVGNISIERNCYETGYEPLQLVYLDKEQNVVRSRVKNFLVTDCACL